MEFPDSEASIRLGRQGEWKAVRFGKAFYRRGVDGSVHGPQGVLYPGADKAAQLHQKMLPLMQGSGLSASGLAADIVQRYLFLPAGFYRLQEQAYQALYPEGVPVLPPDRYRDVVFPVTTGCPNGQCTFCGFYRDKPFSPIKNKKGGFSQHIRALFPEGVAGREGIFLGSANALALPVSALADAVGGAIARLGAPKRGVACFGDADYMGRRSVEQWQLLREKGLRQVVLGVETGSAGLRRTIGKSDQLWKTERLASQLKQAGIDVGVTVLTGFMGAECFFEHRQQTCLFLQTLELGEEDRVYISPWFADGALRPDERAFEEAKDMKQLLQDNICARVTAYSSHNFHYFS